MIEKEIFDYLKSELTPTPVYMEIPSNPPTEFVLIEKTGSVRSNLLYSSTIAIQSYSSTLYKAAELNEVVKNVMFLMPDVRDVSSVDLNSDYNFTDSTTKRYRYQAVFDVAHF